MTLYQGIRNGPRREVAAGEDPLPGYTDVYRYTSNFEWGMTGDGASQLAFAMLLHHLRNDAPNGGKTKMGSANTTAMRLHRDFMREVVVRFPVEGWTMTSDEIAAWISMALEPVVA